MFNQEIRDAVDGTDRMIVVLGPAALASPSVRAEWQYALNVCKIVIPVLRQGANELVPDPLPQISLP